MPNLLWKKQINCFSKAESCCLSSKSIFVITSLITQVIISRWIFNLHTRPLCANTLEKMAKDLILHAKGQPYEHGLSSITDWMEPLMERQDNKGRNLGSKITLLWILMDILKKLRFHIEVVSNVKSFKSNTKFTVTCSYKRIKSVDVQHVQENSLKSHCFRDSTNLQTFLREIL